MKAPAWYRITRWAQDGGWERRCNNREHLSFARAEDLIEIILVNGRAHRAQWYRQNPDGAVILLGEAKEELAAMRDWFVS